MTDPIVTDAPRAERTDDGAIRVTSATNGGAPLWFSVPEEHAELLSARADHIAVGLLLPAMRYGRDLHVGGTVTGGLLHRLNHEVQSLVRQVHPTYSQVVVTAENLAASLPRAAGIATGFSGGIDSMAVLSEYALARDVPDELRITHLLSNNVGAHGTGGHPLWLARFQALLPVAKELQLPFIMVDSNLEDHYPRMGFFETVTFRNAAVAHLLAGGIGRLHYASGESFRSVQIPTDGDIGTVDTMSLPLLSTLGLSLDSANSDLSRVEKTLALIGNPYARYLDVCVDTDATRSANCSRCWKCMRAMFTLEVAGALDDFTPTPFSREPYDQARRAFVAGLLADERANYRDVVEFADSQGWKWGAGNRMRGLSVKAYRRSKLAAGQARARLRGSTARQIHVTDAQTRA
jgi:hypothetical protein